MTDTFRDLGTLAAALAAIVGLFVVLSRLPPLRWVWRHLVSDPASQWFRREIREELESRNGGLSLMDKVMALDERLDDHTVQDAANFHALEKSIAALPHEFPESS